MCIWTFPLTMTQDILSIKTMKAEGWKKINLNLMCVTHQVVCSCFNLTHTFFLMGNTLSADYCITFQEIDKKISLLVPTAIYKQTKHRSRWSYELNRKCSVQRGLSVGGLSGGLLVFDGGVGLFFQSGTWRPRFSVREIMTQTEGGSRRWTRPGQVRQRPSRHFLWWQRRDKEILNFL